MKHRLTITLLLGTSLLLSACGSRCPPERISYSNDLSHFPTGGTGGPSSPAMMEIKGEQVRVSRVISGPVCNETWSGTVYVTCDIEIPSWERDPFFFQDCDFDVEEGTTVYVEAHHDKQFEEGCSCHE